MELSHLLVPRRSGFWRVGVLEGCAEEDYLNINDEVLGSDTSLFAFLWAGPVRTQPEARSNIDDLMRYAPTFKVGRCSRRDIHCSNDFRTRIEWIWPEYISLDTGSSTSCGAHPDGSVEYSIQGLTEREKLSAIEALGASAEPLFRQAFEAARRENQEDRNGECGGNAAFDARSWYIVREEGTWRAKGWHDTDRLCGYGFDYVIKTELSRITGRQDDASRWPTFKARWPQIEDLHTSPAGEWTLIDASSELIILAGSSSDREVLRVPKSPNERVVMVEWANGQNVSRWNDQVIRLRRSKERSPRLVLP